MKLTNEDLRRIILEETNSVLKEFHEAVDDSSSESFLTTKDEEENPEPETSSDLGEKFIDSGKKLKSDADLRRDVKPAEGGVASGLVGDIMSIVSREGNNTTLLNKIKKAVEMILKAEN